MNFVKYLEAAFKKNNNKKTKNGAILTLQLLSVYFVNVNVI